MTTRTDRIFLDKLSNSSLGKILEVHVVIAQFSIRHTEHVVSTTRFVHTTHYPWEQV